MKALIISNLTRRFQPGHYTMIDPLKELGYEVHWAANFVDYKENINEVPIKIHHIDFIRNPFNPFNLKAYYQLMKLLKDEKYDVIHCNSPIGGVLGRICGRQAKVPKIIYTAHGFHFYKGAPLINIVLFKAVELYLARYTDAIITINTEDFEAAQEFKLHNNGNVYYVPGVGIDTEKINNSEEKRKELLKEIDADNDSLIIISVGELNKNKNNEVIINAIGKLRNHKIHYILCGVGNEKKHLENLAKINGLEDNVHFLGYRTDVYKLLKSSDIFVMPSIREGLSRSIMEAMASGLPCIVSKIRGNVDLIIDGKSGYLVDFDNVDGFAKNIEFLAENKELRNSMSKYNLERVKIFHTDNIKQHIKLIYEKELC